MSEGFVYGAAKSKNVLKGKEEAKKKPLSTGRPKAAAPKKKKITCYFTDEEFQRIQDFLDGRPASASLSRWILEKVNS